MYTPSTFLKQNDIPVGTYFGVYRYAGDNNDMSGTINLNGKNLTVDQAIYNPGAGKTSTVSINFADGAEILFFKELGLSTNSTNILTISGFDASEDFLIVGKSTTDYSDHIYFADLGTKGVDYEIIKAEKIIDSVKYSLYSYKLAIPEPSTYAMIFGAIALGFVAFRRRK